MLQQRRPQGESARRGEALEGELIKRRGACAASIIEAVFEMKQFKIQGKKMAKWGTTTWGTRHLLQKRHFKNIYMVVCMKKQKKEIQKLKWFQLSSVTQSQAHFSIFVLYRRCLPLSLGGQCGPFLRTRDLIFHWHYGTFIERNNANSFIKAFSTGPPISSAFWTIWDCSWRSPLGNKEQFRPN